MKKPNFSLQKFESANIQTLAPEELNFIMGSTAAVAQCSTSGDSDSQCSNCSGQNDKDDQ